ncbi:MAG: cysteine--tRNA ligase [Actinomycetota bacterium]
MKIYDTLTRSLAEITHSGSKVTMYCCGPTVYRDAHVGNLRTFLLSDLIRRTLELQGNSVVQIQNITDVGHMSEDFHDQDKLLTQAKLEKQDPYAIARKYEEGFHLDTQALNILPATGFPRASDHITLMQELISSLIAQGNAYIGSDKSVYFDAASYPGYGELSGNKLDALKPGHRYEYSDDDGKKFHADWALWKSAGSRSEMVWESPWGLGFPGWHIECSAMSMKYLDAKIDIHVGGIDLRFPHHEDERAQSNSYLGRECVNLWVHGEHLLFEGRKMSKSAGNVVLIRDLISRGFDPLALRLVFLENRYRSQMDLTWETIAAANKTISRWRKLFSEVRGVEPQVNEEILESLNDDLDTPQVIQAIRKVEKSSDLTLEEKSAFVLYADKVLGLDLHRKPEVQLLTSELQKLIDDRAAAREAKDWDRSDALRKILESHGLVIQDSASGQEWSWADPK